jgi:hypothetical protein
MDQNVIEISEDREEAVEDQQVIELPLHLLDKVGGGGIVGFSL